MQKVNTVDINNCGLLQAIILNIAAENPGISAYELTKRIPYYSPRYIVEVLRGMVQDEIAERSSDGKYTTVSSAPLGICIYFDPEIAYVRDLPQAIVYERIRHLKRATYARLKNDLYILGSTRLYKSLQWLRDDGLIAKVYNHRSVFYETR
ncbi:MAG: hypothetical protein ACI4DP_00105 [Candidatus Ornithomonoglobus sp.]